MKILASLTALILFSLTHISSAQASRTWVSGVGDDVNPGSRTAPCKTFAGVISKTAAKGVINILDPGSFGAVTITKSITIDGGGMEGNILGAAVNGIVINAAATDVVILRNLQLDGFETGLAGVKIFQAGAVYLENCRIKGFTTGIEEVNAAATGVQVTLRNCAIEECLGAGISLTPAATSSSVAFIDKTTIQACNQGVVVNPKGKAILSNSVVCFSVADGLKRVGTGLIQSFKNNQIFGNTPDGAPNGALKAK
ncbi:right-handed parallel beta-helix repeat-containing protein [Haloferula sp. BvORR071]|uniref:right-handed parallel beta-helix repeat-containing protein n=1 Tax=Haloferula sp. BvORR071 TaxID=1396141 RepID=UPI00054DEC0F|nr:right-handed parallel beta-helix repeat-containing protein [Haloferula sp. BvORR071]